MQPYCVSQLPFKSHYIIERLESTLSFTANITWRCLVCQACFADRCHLSIKNTLLTRLTKICKALDFIASHLLSLKHGSSLNEVCSCHRNRWQEARWATIKHDCGYQQLLELSLKKAQAASYSVTLCREELSKHGHTLLEDFRQGYYVLFWDIQQNGQPYQVPHFKIYLIFNNRWILSTLVHSNTNLLSKLWVLLTWHFILSYYLSGQDNNRTY